MVGEIVVVAIAIGAVLPAVVVWWWAADSQKVKVHSGVNDDSAVVDMFVRVLRAAKERLIIHDDGDKIAGTVYDDRTAIEAVRNRLEECSTLEIRCLFNDQADLDMVRELRNAYPGRFLVTYRSGDRPDRDIHYKIADDGVVGHLSSHGHGQPERNFKLLNCTNARPRTRKRVFGRCIRQFNQDAESATTPA